MEFTTCWRAHLEQLVSPTSTLGHPTSPALSSPAAPSSALASSSSSTASAGHLLLPWQLRPTPPSLRLPIPHDPPAQPSSLDTQPPPAGPAASLTPSPPSPQRQLPRPLFSMDPNVPHPKQQPTLDLWMQASNPSSSTTTPGTKSEPPLFSSSPSPSSGSLCLRYIASNDCE